MPVYDWNEWSANQGAISRRLRELADQWDKGLTEANPELLQAFRAALDDIAVDTYWALEDAPPTPEDAAASQVDLMEDR